MSLNKVLVIDDSDLIHNMYKIMLGKYKGCKVVSAKNGREGIDALTVEEDIDLVLLDINMPVMNGLQFLNTIREEGVGEGVPVIIISTEGKEEDTLKGLSMGAKGYVVKPFKPDILHGLIKDVLRSDAPGN